MAKDVTEPEIVELSVRDDGKVVWVNIDGACALRACRIKHVVVDDKRVSYHCGEIASYFDVSVDKYGAIVKITIGDRKIVYSENESPYITNDKIKWISDDCDYYYEVANGIALACGFTIKKI